MQGWREKWQKCWLAYGRSEVTNFIFTMGLKMIIEIYCITRNCSYSYILLLPMLNHDFNSLHQIDKKCVWWKTNINVKPGFEKLCLKCNFDSSVSQSEGLSTEKQNKTEFKICKNIPNFITVVVHIYIQFHILPSYEHKLIWAQKMYWIGLSDFELVIYFKYYIKY